MTVSGATLIRTGKRVLYRQQQRHQLQHRHLLADRILAKPTDKIFEQCRPVEAQVHILPQSPFKLVLDIVKSAHTNFLNFVNCCG